MFLRPRRFGKSAFAFHAGNYYYAAIRPDMKQKMNEAEKRLKEYGCALEKKYGNLRLKMFAVAALGFERLWAKEVFL